MARPRALPWRTFSGVSRLMRPTSRRRPSRPTSIPPGGGPSASSRVARYVPGPEDGALGDRAPLRRAGRPWSRARARHRAGLRAAAGRAGRRVVVNDLGGSMDGVGTDAGPAAAVAAEIMAAGGAAVADANDVASPRRGAGPGRHGGRAVRAHRRRGEQRRHRPLGRAPEADADNLERTWRYTSPGRSTPLAPRGRTWSSRATAGWS